eukprot:3134743-Pleurochrysis_carterae.AAC.1
MLARPDALNLNASLSLRAHTLLCACQHQSRGKTALATASAAAMFEDKRIGIMRISSGTQVRRMGLARVGERRG